MPRFSLLLPAATLCLAAAAPAAPGGIPWEKALDPALRKAAARNQLVMVDFYTDWCGYCKKLDREVFPNAKVIQAARRFVPVKLNAEKEGRAAALRYKVRSFPTILFLDGKGNAIAVIPGFVPAKEFVTGLAEVRAIHRKKQAAAARR